MARCILITGAARRIGAEIARNLHDAGYRVIIHYRSSAASAASLRDELNRKRPGSAEILEGDLAETGRFEALAGHALSLFGRIDGLVNNASAFYPTPLDAVTEAQWDELLGCNLKAPFFLSQALACELRKRKGGIINISDIHGLRPLQGFSVYSISKAGLVAMTQALAKELAPSVRVNGIAPGAILWPEHEISEAGKAQILGRIPLKRQGMPGDIAKTARFLLENDYITGQVIPVDGGRILYS